MQKLTTRQALAAIVAIVEAWEPDGLARVDDASTVRTVLGALADHGLTTERGEVTDAGRALLTEAPRTAEEERADTVVFLDEMAKDPAYIGLVYASVRIAQGNHDGALARSEAARAAKVAACKQEMIAAGRCLADSDGDCSWSGCPQTRDGEPAKSRRSCPRWVATMSEDDDDR